MYKSETQGLNAHLKVPSGAAGIFATAKHLHALNFSIAQWVLFYHKDDAVFCQTFRELITGSDYLAAELEYRINPKMAVKEMEKEVLS